MEGIDLDALLGSAPVKPVIVENPVTGVCPPPGIYYDVPAAEYHSWPAIGSTLLKGYAELPSTCRKPWVPGDDGNVGTGIHTYSLLGKDAFHQECMIGPKFGKGKADAEERQALAERYPTMTILPPYYGSPAPGQKIMDVIEGVDNSLRTHPKTKEILANSVKEVSLVWIDEASGCLCKARLDIWHDGKFIWDLKKDRAIDSFQWHMKDLNYWVQAGFYFEGAICCGLPAVAFGFIPCEAVPPYRVECGYCDPEKLEKAREDARRLVGLVKQSQITGYWPNFRIPDYIYNLDDIKPDDLVMVY